MNDKTLQRLRDARRHARLSLEALDRFGADLVTDVFASLALERSVEITGEALRAIMEHDPEFVARAPGLPWKPAIRLRTRLAHGYSNIETDFLVETVRAEFPELLSQLDSLLEAFE
ncbi:MAG: HepT-like ribonuclease domain-containing protein [Oceanicaulis sp.]